MGGIDCCSETQNRWGKPLLTSLKGGLKTISSEEIPSPGRRVPVWTFKNISLECFLIQCQKSPGGRNSACPAEVWMVKPLPCGHLHPAVANISQAHVPWYHSSFWCTQIFQEYLKVPHLHCNYSYCGASKYKHWVQLLSVYLKLIPFPSQGSLQFRYASKRCTTNAVWLTWERPGEYNWPVSFSSILYSVWLIIS